MNPLLLVGTGITVADMIVKLSSMYSQKQLTEPELLALVSVTIGSVKQVNKTWEQETGSAPVGGA